MLCRPKPCCVCHPAVKASKPCAARHAGPEGDTEAGDLNRRQSRKLDRAVTAVQESRLALWVLGGGVTAGGRILADVHW